MTAYIFPDPVMLPPLLLALPPVQGEDYEPTDFGGGVQAALRSVDALKAFLTAPGKVVELIDDIRAGYWIWDPTVPTAAHQADPQEAAFIAPNPSLDGAWVNYYADPRLGYWANSVPGARYLRSKSGLKLGDAAGIKGDPTAGETWLSEMGGNPYTWQYMEWGTVLSLRTNNGMAGTFGARAWNSNANALYAVAHGDSPNVGHGVWAGYFEGVRGPNGAGTVRAVEMNGVNRGVAPEQRADVAERAGETPYMAVPANLTMVLALAAGGDQTIWGVTKPLDEYLRLNRNGARPTDVRFPGGAFAGILVRHDALVREGAGQHDYAPVIRAPQGVGYSWYGATDGGEAARVWSDVSHSTFRQGLYFSDAGLRYARGVGNATQLFIAFTPASVNYLKVSAAVAGSPVTIETAGADANIGLRLVTKGTGDLQLPANGSDTGSMTPTRRIRVKLADGSSAWLLASHV